MKTGKLSMAEVKKENKKVVAHGFGVAKMMDVCYKKGLTCNNSELVVKDSGNLDSEWWVIADKGQIVETPVEIDSYELTPRNGRKSFYGKAFVKVFKSGKSKIEELYSYTSLIIRKRTTPQGNTYFTRLYDADISNTTSCHLIAFCGLNKPKFAKLPYGKEIKVKGVGLC